MSSNVAHSNYTSVPGNIGLIGNPRNLSGKPGLPSLAAKGYVHKYSIPSPIANVTYDVYELPPIKDGSSSKSMLKNLVTSSLQRPQPPVTGTHQSIPLIITVGPEQPIFNPPLQSLPRNATQQNLPVFPPAPGTYPPNSNTQLLSTPTFQNVPAQPQINMLPLGFVGKNPAPLPESFPNGPNPQTTPSLPQSLPKGNDSGDTAAPYMSTSNVSQASMASLPLARSLQLP